MSSGINGIADEFEKHALQSPAMAPVDMVALETVLMEPLEEPPAPAPIVDMVALKAVLEEPPAPAPIVDMVALKAVLMGPFEEPPPAPIVDMVALKAVLMEPLEEPRANLDKLAALLKALPYAQMLALGASICATQTPRTRLTREILPEVLYRWALTRASGG
jgi:hypothetical protein